MNWNKCCEALIIIGSIAGSENMSVERSNLHLEAGNDPYLV
jgi:hypothetical protein